jgi:hypothetical protein
MKTKSGHISIAELREQMEGKTIVANHSYQRAAGLWPRSAKSYFIDTIVNDYPFQSVYIHEYVNKGTKRIKKDIVDGQQRLTTIFEYISDEFSLGTSMKSYPGKKFSQLPDDVQDSILSYAIPVITISQSDSNEILEMFRRMNAFMVPLNPAEKRHSQFGGEFKWFINRLADEFSPLFNAFGTLTEKQIVRMGDTELITDFSDIVDRGIQNRQPAAFSNLYKKYDESFQNEDEFFEKIYGALDFIRTELGEIAGTYANRGYVLYSLVAALLHNRWGILQTVKERNTLDFEPTGQFCAKPSQAIKNILTLASAHETKDEDGAYKDYVEACISTTHRVAQRVARAKWLLRALRDEM